MPAFQLGNVVALKSGSRDRTVTAVIEDGEGYNVAWEDDHGAPQERYYPAEALELASVQRERQRQEGEAENRKARRVVDEAGATVARRYFD
jgi:uncharacterized protein YodC (DUF2158 family)